MFENVENNEIAKLFDLLNNHPEFMNLPPLNVDAFQDLRETIGDDVIFSDLVTIYFNSAENLIDSIQLALVNQDSYKFTIAAHSLKSTSASIGATRLSKICKYLENAGKTGQITMSSSSEIIDLLNDEYTKAITEIKSYILGFMSE